MPIKTKHIPKVLVDYTEDIERHIANIKKRRDVAKSLSEAGYIDAPYIPYMVSLGPSDGRYEFTRDTTPDNRKSYYTYDYDTGSYRLVGRIRSFDAKYDYFEKVSGGGWIYKINAPGWIYIKQTDGEASNTKGRFGVLLSSSPTNLASSSGGSRLLYMAGTENNTTDGTDMANNMFPIYPGTSTYAYIVRAANPSVLKEVYFVPSVMSACYNIHPMDYASIVGCNSSDIELSGGIDPGDSACQSIFGEKEDWTTNFRTMFGFNVANELNNKMIFTGTGKDEFIKRRCAWLSKLGVSLSKYETVDDRGYPCTYEEYLQ